MKRISKKRVDTLYVACNQKEYGCIREVHGMVEPCGVFSTQAYQGATNIWSFGIDVFDGARDESENVFMLSIANATRLVHIMGRELVDATEICGILPDNSTVFGGSISGESVVVQVQPDRMNVVLIERYGDSIKAKSVKTLSFPGFPSVVLLRSNFLFIAMGDPKVIMVFSDLDSGYLEINELKVVGIKFEVSSMISHCLSSGEPVCILATYEPAIRIIPLDDLKEGSIEGVTVYVEQSIHYLEYVENNSGQYLIGGTRTGDVSSWMWDQGRLYQVVKVTVGTFLYQMKCLDGKIVAFTKPRPVVVDASNGSIVTDFI